MNAARETAGVIVRPPVLFLGALLLGVAFEFALPLWPSEAAWRWPAALVLTLAAFAVFIPAALRFRAHGTNIPTDRPSLALVADGPYRYSRNPIYIGLTLLYLGLSVAAASAWSLALIIPVLVVLRYGVIAREERYLEARFGDAYRGYKSRVRRWI